MICISIQKTPFEETLALLESPAVEMAELRLDLSDYTVREVERLCSLPVPVIATCRYAVAGAEKTEEQLSAAICAGAAFTDIELEMPKALSVRLCEQARGHGCRVIRSWHDFKGTPGIETLEAKVRECLAGGADIVKVVTTALSQEDSAKVLSLYSDEVSAGLEGRLVAFAMGEAGRQSRVASLGLGAPFTYACMDGRPTAPGQPEARDIYMQIYGRVSPLRLIDGKIEIPQSKSAVQRRIIAAALAGEDYEIDENDLNDDVRAAMSVSSLIKNRMIEKKNGVEKQ